MGLPGLKLFAIPLILAAAPYCPTSVLSLFLRDSINMLSLSSKMAGFLMVPPLIPPVAY